MIAPPEKSGLRNRKKERTRARLMEKAIALFAQHGIEHTTVDQIALAAEIGKGTVYNYFATKEDIVVAFMAELERRAQPAVKRFSESGAPIEEILAGFAWQLLYQKRQFRSFVRAFLARIMTPDDSFHEYVIEMQLAIDANLAALFTRLQEKGKVRSDLPIADLLMNFKTMHLGLTMVWALEGPPWRETRKVLRAQMAMFGQGVKP